VKMALLSLFVVLILFSSLRPLFTAGKFFFPVLRGPGFFHLFFRPVFNSPLVPSVLTFPVVQLRPAFSFWVRASSLCHYARDVCCLFFFWCGSFSFLRESVADFFSCAPSPFPKMSSKVFSVSYREASPRPPGRSFILPDCV